MTVTYITEESWDDKMTEQEAIEWIHSRLPFGSRPGLTRINALLTMLGEPQKELRVIHVGGTNGKGSTVAFLRCLLQEQGFSVGTYTSPYIEVFNERISLNGVPILGEELVQLVEQVQPLVAQLDQSEETKGITEFEIMTGMMFCYFAAKQPDFVIVEVGLGGLLDCTNVVDPLVSVITTIGYDHTDILGETIEEIAYQKAGIIKENRPVVTGNICSAAMQVIEETAAKFNSPIYRINQEFSVIDEGADEQWGERMAFQNSDWQMKHLFIPLLGKHQSENAGVALEAFYLLSDICHFHFTNKEIQRAMEQVQWAGRMEKVSDEPLIILDGAHNDHAIQVLADNLKKDFANRNIYVLFAALTTKDISKMIPDLLKVPRLSLAFCEFDYPKATKKEKYQEMFGDDRVVYSDWRSGIASLLQQMSSDDVLLITGSLYFISQVREGLLNSSEDNSLKN